MAVRLQMKLGVIAEPDRSPNSPDTVVVVEPSIGAIARSKGHLYLIVTSTIASARAQEATQLAAETIRGEYYYDESAGIRVCIEKAIASANKRLNHQRERLGLHGTAANGPIGIGIAVVRGNELYVATIGPAEAYLIRQARLSTLPDPHRERGLPTGELEPDVWRGEISVGDSLVLVSPNVMSRLGPDELKDAMVTLHPQPAMEHLHHRFFAADGSGSDAMIAFEATEVASTHRSRTLVPVRPAEPLAGAPDRSPIPLADNVTGGVAAVQASATRARSAAGGLFTRLVQRAQDFLPHRRTSYRRVTPAAAKRETQRRAAVAILAFVVVMVSLGGALWALGGGGPGVKTALSSEAAGVAAVRTINANLDQVFAPGVDLVVGDPTKAYQLLSAAWDQIETAKAANVPAVTLDPLRATTQAGLDRLFHVVPVAAATILATAGAKTPLDIGAMIVGPQGMPFILDRATSSVYRVDLRTKKATVVFRAKASAPGGIEGTPRLITTASRDLVMIDNKNVVWRWRPADTSGRGTIHQIPVTGQFSWGDDIVAVGTFLKQPSTGLYNLYVVDPSAQNILAYSPDRDGSGFHSNGQPRLTVARDVSKITDLLIDGFIFAADGGAITRFFNGKAEGWGVQAPGTASFAPQGDVLLRPAPYYTLIASASDKGTGLLYAWDRANGRVVAFDKDKGTFVAQYRLAGGGPGLADVRGMYVVLPSDPSGATTLVWATKDAVMSAVLEAVAETPGPGASGAPGSSSRPASPGPSSKASRAP
ncbi:MAG: family protein phosphatase [Chloroflexota bacterium]|nr:family protein phosphatase [Chloroflexota bacterium]